MVLNVNLKQLKSLLNILKPYHPSLPLDPRTVVGTPRTTVVKKLNNGDYVHVRLKRALLARLQSGTKSDDRNLLEVDVNVDGPSCSHSSNLDAWPILGRCVDLVINKPFVTGVFWGSSKPDPLKGFLEDYICETEDLVSLTGFWQTLPCVY